MNEKKKILVFVIVGAFISMGCVCKWFDTEETRNELFNRSDYVIKGRVFKNIDSNFIGRYPEDIGKDIFFIIDKAYKGNIKTDTILILQDRSNCSRIFSSHDDTLLIYGSEIKHFHLTDEIHEYGYDDNLKIYYFQRKNREYELSKNLSSKNLALYTGGCIIFDISDQGMKNYLERNK